MSSSLRHHAVAFLAVGVVGSALVVGSVLASAAAIVVNERGDGTTFAAAVSRSVNEASAWTSIAFVAAAPLAVGFLAYTVYGELADVQEGGGVGGLVLKAVSGASTGAPPPPA